MHLAQGRMFWIALIHNAKQEHPSLIFLMLPGPAPKVPHICNKQNVRRVGWRNYSCACIWTWHFRLACVDYLAHLRLPMVHGGSSSGCLCHNYNASHATTLYLQDLSSHFPGQNNSDLGTYIRPCHDVSHILIDWMFTHDTVVLISVSRPYIPRYLGH